MLAIAAAGLLILATLGRTPVPPSGETHETARARLPVAYWCYWAMLGLGVAIEFSAILWAPAYLEQVIGLDATSAAIGAAAFFGGMLIGRVSGAGLFRLFPIRRLFFAAAATVFAGFLLYRFATDPIPVITGLFIVGLGTALLFPLGLSFAITAAGPAAERGATRIMLAPGLAILIAPPLLGVIADAAGLGAGLLVMPAFIGLGVIAFFFGQAAERKRAHVS